MIFFASTIFYTVMSVKSLSAPINPLPGDVPPLQSPVVIVPVSLVKDQMVIEAHSMDPEAILFTNDLGGTVELQQWFIVPSNISANEFFVKMYYEKGMVIESPQVSGQAFINIQGDRIENGGIQVWVFEKVKTDIWRLRNFKTGLYLYLDTTPQEHWVPPHLPVLATDEGIFNNANWIITEVVGESFLPRK